VPTTPQEGHWWEGGQKIASQQEFTTRRLDTQLDRLTRKQAGRRSVTKTERKRGRYIQSRLPKGDKVRDLAFDATFRAAAPHQIRRDRTRLALALEKSDLREKVRVRRSANLILFVVDASWSMAVAERMEATKGAILSLLTDAYQRRDRVGLIVFNKNDANLVLPPTNSVQLARKALMDIAVGGKTPLSAGLYLAYQVFRQEAYSHPDVLPLMILLTDGAGNVSMTDLPPQQEKRTKSPNSLPKRTCVRWSSTWNTPPSTRGWPACWPKVSAPPATHWRICGRIRCIRRCWIS
jgi:Mg-chelatase subunit ChlD